MIDLDKVKLGQVWRVNQPEDYFINLRKDLQKLGLDIQVDGYFVKIIKLQEKQK